MGPSKTAIVSDPPIRVSALIYDRVDRRQRNRPDAQQDHERCFAELVSDEFGICDDQNPEKSFFSQSRCACKLEP